MENKWNITLKIKDENVLELEKTLNIYFDVISFKILPDTEKMYEENTTFKKLVKGVKDAQRLRDKYINDHNSEYKK